MRQGPCQRRRCDPLSHHDTYDCPGHRPPDRPMGLSHHLLDPRIDRLISYRCGCHRDALLHVGDVLLATSYDNRFPLLSRKPGHSPGLNPHYPPWYLWEVSFAYRMTGRYAQAIAALQEL